MPSAVEQIQQIEAAGASAIGSRTVTVTAGAPANQPPNAAFDASTLTPQVGQTVTFTDRSTDTDGTIVSREWDLDGDGFDDGSGATASRVYTLVGNVQVHLRVTDDDAAQATATRTVSVTTTPPASPNLIANGSFETGVSGWTTWRRPRLRRWSRRC